MKEIKMYYTPQHSFHIIEIYEDSVQASLSLSLSLFCLKFQQIPRKFNWEEKVQQGSTQWEGLMAISKLFDERPIWPRRSLTERLLDNNLKLGYHLLKRLSINCFLLH